MLGSFGGFLTFQRFALRAYQHEDLEGLLFGSYHGRSYNSDFRLQEVWKILLCFFTYVCIFALRQEIMGQIILDWKEAIIILLRGQYIGHDR